MGTAVPIPIRVPIFTSASASIYIYIYLSISIYITISLLPVAKLILIPITIPRLPSFWRQGEGSDADR